MATQYFFKILEHFIENQKFYWISTGIRCLEYGEPLDYSLDFVRFQGMRPAPGSTDYTPIQFFLYYLSMFCYPFPFISTYFQIVFFIITRLLISFLLNIQDIQDEKTSSSKRLNIKWRVYLIMHNSEIESLLRLSTERVSCFI